MSRFIPQGDMTANELLQCSYQAVAILRLCETAASAIDTGGNHITADSISSGLRLAIDLLGPVHDALEKHEGVKEVQS